MYIKIISAVLILVTVWLSIRHRLAGFRSELKPEEAKMMDVLGVGRPAMYAVSVLTLLSGVMILFPPTFFAGNLLNAGIILLIMGLALRGGSWRMALIEIPFLLIPLVLIWLGHPLKK